METQNITRRLPVGAEVLPQGGIHFRVWAPKVRSVQLVMEGDAEVALSEESHNQGIFSGFVANANHSTRYRFRLGEGSELFPDPASRFQPEGPHGPSQVVDPGSYQWGDLHWRGCEPEGQIIYEMHIGTFSRSGTWTGAMELLPVLADLGVTVLELMPVADFTGRFGWGYDGVDLFAPTRLYGTPDEMRAFVDRAHSLNLGVILDVVYNHLGPDGNFLASFADEYFTDRYANDWGQAINFDGDDARHVREFFIGNAKYWIDEFHLDGLRLDATQSIFDATPSNVIAQIVETARQAANGRSIIIVAENEPQETRLVRPASDGGYDVDMLWNDDFHHAAMVVMSAHNEAYYSDYLGTPQEFISAAKWGYLYQGQRYKWQNQRRGTPTSGLTPASFVHFLQNHDQIANSARGLRCHQLTSPGRLRAMTALSLLMPGTPMLFQGQEFAASTPFLYFADHNPELRSAVLKGRAEFLAQFPSLSSPEALAQLSDPGDPETFERCKLDFAERDHHADVYAFHRDLIQMRRNDPVLRSPQRTTYDGAVLGSEAFVLRFFGGQHPDRLLIINFGRDLSLDVVPEPLLAPPAREKWRMAWSSEDHRYGGMGVTPPETEDGWRICGQSAVLLISEEESQSSWGDDVAIQEAE